MIVHLSSYEKQVSETIILVYCFNVFCSGIVH